MAMKPQRNPDRATDVELVTDEVLSEDEPTKEQILEGIRIGVRQALSGETTPFEQLIEEARREMVSDGDESQNQQAIQ